MAALGTQIDWGFPPLEVFKRWPHSRRIATLYSGRYHPKWARRTIFAEPVGSYRFTINPHGGPDSRGWPCGHSQWVGPANFHPVADGFKHHPFDDLRSILDRNDGMWIGYLGYDLGRWVERLPAAPATAVDDLGWPIIELGYCPGYLVYDLLTKQWTAHGTYATSGPPVLSQSQWDPVWSDLGRPQSELFGEPYQAIVQHALDYIAAGDIFQVNLAQRFTAELSTVDAQTSRDLFRKLAKLSPPWYGAYLELAGRSSSSTNGDAPALSGRSIASISPELFLEVEHQQVTTRPIKGTLPAHADPVGLVNSEKDAAELNMIVDLMRNDLGRVCEYGSVHVIEPRTIESHPTVHHGVSTITGRLHASKDIVDLLRACMPGGSVTGAPKVRAMQIIDELEPVRRGPYCGCIGYLTRESCCLNIAIRTMLIDRYAGRVDFSVGAGIVADSKPHVEHHETLDKAAAILATMGGRQEIAAR